VEAQFHGRAGLVLCFDGARDLPALRPAVCSPPLSAEQVVMAEGEHDFSAFAAADKTDWAALNPPRLFIAS